MTVLSAREIYDELTFTNPDAFFNNPAPDPLVAFIIGGILSTIGFIWWVIRYRAFVKDMKTVNMNLKIRMMISAAIDSDKNRFVMVTYAAVSFLFLGGLQVSFDYTLAAMVIFYTFSSSLESVRIMLAYHSVGDENQDDLMISSEIMLAKFNKYNGTNEIKPANVYEDLGRNLTIVTMVFITQVVLILFVCVDVRNNNVSSCLDGTKGCPIAGTLGSWLFFILGIFMALVFQLGPKTNFGESEQNPYYWLRLFLVLKNDKATISWNNEMKGKESFSAGDFRIWIRYFMSFLINGVGFHILVHALPLQVASQSSLTGVVFRAIGMMYLVDLDDTPGHKLTIHDNIHDATDSNKVEDIDKIDKAIKEALAAIDTLKELAINSSNVVNKGTCASIKSKTNEIEVDGEV